MAVRTHRQIPNGTPRLMATLRSVSELLGFWSVAWLLNSLIVYSEGSVSVWYEGGSALLRLMDVVVQTGLKAVMVEGQLIVKLIAVSRILFFLEASLL